MGIVSRMIQPRAMASAGIDGAIRSFFGGAHSTASGVSVSHDTAMRQATVYSCINVLSRTIGQLPCHLMQQDGKIRKKALDHPLYPILHDMPNEWMTAPEFWGMAINHLTLRGNFYALKNRPRGLSGNIRELIPLAPGAVQDVKQDKNFKLTYRCQFPDGGIYDIPGSEIMHVRGMTIDGYRGVSPIAYIRECIGLAQATEEFGARYFGSGTHPGMIVEHPGTLKDPAKLRDALGATYSGLGKTHRLMLLEEGMKAHPIAINPEDSQFLETRKFQKSEIVDIFFGMPLTVMNPGESTPTYASAEQFSIGFIVYALMPWIVSTEKAIYRDLLQSDERSTYYAKFRAEGLQRGSFRDQMEGFAKAIDKEIMSPNECRELLDLNPYEGGDEYRTRTSTVKQGSNEPQKGSEKY